MYKILVDPHTHTIASGHGFSTIEENAIHAKKEGLEAIAMTDHYSPLFSPMDSRGFPVWGPWMNMPALPRVIHDVTILAGVEIDIVDAKGHLFTHDFVVSHENIKADSFLQYTLSTREVTIASVHGFEGSKSLAKEDGTKMYCNVLENPQVHIIGHPMRPQIPFDIKQVVSMAKTYGKIFEINDHSFDFSPQVIENCKSLAIECAKQGVYVCVSSDAHSAFFIGKFDKALTMLESIHFPEELIANTTLEKFLSILQKTQ